MIAANYNKQCIICLLAWLSALCSPAQKSGIEAIKGVHFNFGPSIGFYTINNKHAVSPYQKASALAGFKKEWTFGGQRRSSLLTGMDYFFHGLGFRSYYFYPDSIPLYNKSFAYNYSLFIHELHLPLQLKLLFRRKDSRLFSTYIQLAYHLRILVSSDLKITQNGSKVKYDSPYMKFRNPLISDRLNPFVSISYGLQKNSVGLSKGKFFVELNFKYGFSPYYFERVYAASSLFINSAHLSLILGIRL